MKMELEQKKSITLANGKRYMGFGYYSGNQFIPHGCGKTFHKGYYSFGNYKHGRLNGPAIISYESYMRTLHFQDDVANGWGLKMERGKITEFGYYKNGKLKSDVKDFVLWYFDKIQSFGIDENILHMYVYKESCEVEDLLIGYNGTAPQNGVSRCYMGFHFVPDGSIWVGTTDYRKWTGNLIHFCPNGTIEVGLFEDGNLIEWKDLQQIFDGYYGYHGTAPDDLGYVPRYRPEVLNARAKFQSVPPIEKGKDYSLPSHSSWFTRLFGK